MNEVFINACVGGGAVVFWSLLAIDALIKDIQAKKRRKSVNRVNVVK